MSAFCTPQDFGAVGDGVADDTVALQSSVDQAGRATLVLCGSYKTTASINVTKSITITGSGYQGDSATDFLSQVPMAPPTLGAAILPAANVTGINVVADDAVHFERFSVMYPTLAAHNSGVAAISVRSQSASARLNVGSTFERLMLYGADQLLSLNRCASFSVRTCQLYQSQSRGISIDNDSTATIGVNYLRNYGDWSIDDVTFWSGSSYPNAHVQIFGGGGGRITRNKMNQGAGTNVVSYGIAVTPSANYQNNTITPLQMNDNSIEDCRYGLYAYEPNNFGALMSLAMFNDNEVWCGQPIAIISQGSGNAYGLPAGTWVDGFMAVNNFLQAEGSGNNCIFIDGARNAVVAPNIRSATNGASSGVTIGSRCQYVYATPTDLVCQ